MTNDFKLAFDETMLFEVGGFWNPKDPEVVIGKCDTREQRRKVGFVNIPADRGGLTKYGIAQRANQGVDVANLDLANAMGIYYRSYWLAGSCDKLAFPLNMLHFDGCVNHGIGRANKFLQKAVGVEADGFVGPITLAKIQSMPVSALISSVSKQREDFYRAIVAYDKSQSIFINGWMRRITEVTKFALSAIK